MEVEFDLSDDQSAALAEIQSWILSGDETELTLGGHAGTGKSTLINRVVQWCESREIHVEVCAYTGKAADVLRRKGIGRSRTLHSLLYRPSEKCTTCGIVVHPGEDENKESTCGLPRNDDDGNPIVVPHTWRTRFSRVQHLGKTNLVIVDEASMLSTGLVEDLRFYGVKALYVGDHGQLEPIGDNPGLMADPELRLENIHRQAAKSAIIRFAHAVRRGENPRRHIGYVHTTEDGDVDLRVLEGTPDVMIEYDIVLCGYNKTRCDLNRLARIERGHSSDLPEPGEWVICLQNNRQHGVFNGQRFQIESCENLETHLLVTLVSESGGRYVDIPCCADTFGLPKQPQNKRRTEVVLDWGYAVTVHKAQGSEWDTVAVVEEINRRWTANRWRYTAVTRAAKELHYYV